MKVEAILEQGSLLCLKSLNCGCKLSALPLQLLEFVRELLLLLLQLRDMLLLLLPAMQSSEAIALHPCLLPLPLQRRVVHFVRIEGALGTIDGAGEGLGQKGGRQLHLARSLWALRLGLAGRPELFCEIA